MNASNFAPVCRTCNRPLSAPWRNRAADGTIRNGCVAADHDDQPLAADDAAWHNRAEARAIRAENARHLAELLA